MSTTKKEIYVPELPEPWKAFYSDRKKRIFYCNMQTKQSTWELPVIKSSSKESDLSAKQQDAKYQERIPKNSKKKDIISQGSSVSRGADGTEIPLALSCLHDLDISNINKPSEELMEIDEISTEGVSNREEPMEIDFVVEKVQAFRREHFLHPNQFPKDILPFSYTTENTRVCETSEKAGRILIVFDSSCLLQDTTLLPMCTQGMALQNLPASNGTSLRNIDCFAGLYSSLIPYTVLQELDGLKKAKSGELRFKAVKTIAYLHDCIKLGCSNLLIENTFEASNGIEEFGCENNDDIILKCAFVTSEKYQNEPVRVIFATNDKNLAVKAAAHNIVTSNRNELLHLLATDSPNGKGQQLITENDSRKISPSNFSFSLLDEPSSSAIKTIDIATPNKVRNHLPVSLQCRSSFPLSTVVREKEEASSISSIVGTKENESLNITHAGKGSCGKSDSIGRREIHRTRVIPYSVRKKGKEGNGNSGRLCKKSKLREINRHSMDDFLDIFAELIQHLQCRRDRKAIEDMKKINKVIDSVIDNESTSLSVLIDIVSKFYDFYADRDVFNAAIHFDKNRLTNQYESAVNIFKKKLLTFQEQLVIDPSIIQ